ncbi:pyridoxamine 5'-phosphate oxidase [Phytoactinopolyspora halotolerans]|uniref:Pyridoxine/pyridoxamine 5'-phosphate oxidase n=2 Tax=Phytoactinopolyspora halotolerans TaxID=1981512 RepID=A0A6L9S1A1_9ACTN|nr:pyridoxamine 5'-phosphate oxidase [Phytoactinopolyspora halotolerans]
MRRRYTSTRLLETDVAAEPFTQFRAWLRDAVSVGLPEPNAMVLATSTPDGIPSSRHVLLKELDGEGFVFFTNHGSQKAAEIAQNPHVSLCFPWFPMERQVVVGGTATAISREESLAYWVTRPRDSQIGAWASRQSSVISSRDELESEAASVAERFAEEVPLPEFWGGFRVVPRMLEFWQGGVGRLHDRLRYRRVDGAWVLERLAP